MVWAAWGSVAFNLVSCGMALRLMVLAVGGQRWALGWGLLALGYALNGAWLLVIYAPWAWLSMLPALCGSVGLWTLWRVVRPSSQTMPAPVAEVVMGWRGTIVAWNTAAVDLLGWTEAEAVGQPLDTFLIPEALMVWYGPAHTRMPAREAHRRGLDQYRLTGTSRILNSTLATMALAKGPQGSPVTIDVNVTLSVQTIEGVTTFLGRITPRAVPPC